MRHDTGCFLKVNNTLVQNDGISVLFPDMKSNSIPSLRTAVFFSEVTE